MHNLYDLAKLTHDEKLRVAARDRLPGRAYAARRAGDRGNSACRPEDPRVLRGRRAARAY
jgi:hypothetical protein